MIESAATERVKDADLTPNPAFPKATVVERNDITDDLMVLKLELKEDKAFAFKPGQYCTLGLAASSAPIPSLRRPMKIRWRFSWNWCLTGSLPR